MDQQVWLDLLHGMGYVLVAFASVYFSGWLIYDKLATKGHCLSKALFEDRNIAAGLEIAAFFLLEFLIAVSAMSGSSITKMAENGEMVIHYSRDLEAIALTIVLSNLLFFTLRYIGSLFVSWIFQGKLDNHGEVVTYNNEIFGQHNLGASLFSMSYMIAIYYMIFQADFLGTQGYQLQGAVNMLVVALTALLAYFLYNLFFMTRPHKVMDELFIDNNAGVGMSLVGFMFAVMHLQSQLSLHFVQEEHFLNSEASTYIYLVLIFVFLLGLRRVFITILNILTNRNFNQDFLEHDNPVVGLLDMTFMASAGLMLAVII